MWCLIRFIACLIEGRTMDVTVYLKTGTVRSIKNVSRVRSSRMYSVEDQKGRKYLFPMENIDEIVEDPHHTKEGKHGV